MVISWSRWTPSVSTLSLAQAVAGRRYLGDHTSTVRLYSALRPRV